MTRFDRIFRDHRESGAINSLIALWGFIDDYTFVTKAGAIGTVFEMSGPDAEALTPEERQRYAHQFESALRLLDENVRVYQYLIKKQAASFTSPECAQVVAREAFERRAAYLNERRGQLFETKQFLVLLLVNIGVGRIDRSLRQLLAHPVAAIRSRLSTQQTFELLELGQIGPTNSSRYEQRRHWSREGCSAEQFDRCSHIRKRFHPGKDPQSLNERFVPASNRRYLKSTRRNVPGSIAKTVGVYFSVRDRGLPLQSLIKCKECLAYGPNRIAYRRAVVGLHSRC